MRVCVYVKEIAIESIAIRTRIAERDETNQINQHAWRLEVQN